MKEIWKAVKGFDGRYEVSNLGNVRSLKYNKQNKVALMHPRLIGSGYYAVLLSFLGDKKMVYVHRLVAEAFIPNPNQLNEINHINEIKTDNRAENLEWCTHSYNINYGTRNITSSIKLSKRVVGTLPNGNKEYYLSQRKAEELLSIGRGSISHCLKRYNGQKTAGGREWSVW